MAKYLILSEAPMTAYTRSGKTSSPEFDVDLLKSWLRYLNVANYDVAYTKDSKFVAWTGPIIALGFNAQHEARRLGKYYVGLPHPNKRSVVANDKKQMRAILIAVRKQLSRGPYVPPKPKIKIVEE